MPVQILISLTAVWTLHGFTGCDVRGAYKQVEVPAGTLATTSMSNVEEVTLILVPTKLDAGKFAVTVTRKAANLYKVDGTQIYLVTRYCYEFAFSQKAILDYQYRGGTLTFED